MELHFPNKLNPKLWDESNQLRDEVREKLLDIAGRFYKHLGVEAPVIDILFTGSLAGYDWHNSSDIDLHIVIDFSLIGSEKFVRGLMNAKKHHFNSMRAGVRIKGFEVECYCQDVSEYHKPSGLFSIRDNRWLIEPKKADAEINFELVRKLISLLGQAIVEVELIKDNQLRLEAAIELKNAIIAMRRVAVRETGEYAEPNLAYKVLRRTGSIDKLFDIIRSSLDRKLSLEQQVRKANKLMLEADEVTEKKVRELIRKELSSIPEEKQIRQMIRQALINQYHWFWDKRNTWVNQI